MKDNDNEKIARHLAFGMTVSGFSREEIIAKLIELDISRNDAVLVLDEAEKFLRVRNFLAGIFFLSMGVLLLVALAVGWAQDLPQESFFKGLMGAVFTIIGLKFLFARSRFLP